MPSFKRLEGSLLVNYGCARPIEHLVDLFPTLRFCGSFQSDMELEEAHYEFEARQGDITLLELIRYKRICLVPKLETNIFDELNEISAVLEQLDIRAFHTADNDLARNVAEIKRVLEKIDAHPLRERHANPVKSVTEVEGETTSIIEKLNSVRAKRTSLTSLPFTETQRDRYNSAFVGFCQTELRLYHRICGNHLAARPSWPALSLGRNATGTRLTPIRARLVHQHLDLA